MPNHEAVPQTAGVTYDTDADSNATRWESVEVGTENKEIGQPFVKEIELSNGEVIDLLSLKVSEANVYHGSPVRGIKGFDVDEGDQFTIGTGIYLAPLKETAAQYANARGSGASGVVYEARIRDMEIADLRYRPAQEEFLKLLRQEIVIWAENALPNLSIEDPYEAQVREVLEDRLRKAIDDIDNGTWVNLRDVAHGFSGSVATALSGRGYGGLISVEKEEGKVDQHDSIVIFDASDIEIISETEV